MMEQKKKPKHEIPMYIVAIITPVIIGAMLLSRYFPFIDTVIKTIVKPGNTFLVLFGLLALAYTLGDYLMLTIRKELERWNREWKRNERLSNEIKQLQNENRQLRDENIKLKEKK